MVLLQAALLSACSGSKPEEGEGVGKLSGSAVKGPISHGIVKVFVLGADGERGTQVGSAETDDAGRFSVEVGSSAGPFLLSVSNGTFVDEASGRTVGVGGDELTRIVPTFSAGTQADNVSINAITHFTAGRTRQILRTQKTSTTLEKAYRESADTLHNHFGALPWDSVVPADLAAANPTVLDAHVKAGLVNAALSQLALGISEAAGGSSVSALDLVKALYEDVSYDGFFDGTAADPLVLPKGMAVAETGPTATRLDASTVRFALARAMEAWLQGPRNKAVLPQADVTQLQNDLSRASNPLIFRTPGDTNGYDRDPPEVTWTVTYRIAGQAEGRAPVGATRLVSGTLEVLATTKDPAGVKRLEVQVGPAPVPPAAQGNSPYRYAGTWTTGDDGQLTLVAHVEDLRGNKGTVPYHLVVDNTPPRVDVAAPANNAFFASAVPLEATAWDANGVLSFEATQPVAGKLPNVSGVVGTITGSWTVKLGEADGATPVTFVAYDAVGLRAAVERTVHVDKAPPRLKLVSVIPEWTNQTTLNVTVEAADSAGIADVFVSRGATPVKLSQSNANPSRYSGSITLGTGRNDLDLWAIDGVGNSGHSLAAVDGDEGFHLQKRAFLDQVPPLVTNVVRTDGAGYQSEQNISLKNANVPAEWDNFGPEVALASGGTVWKTSARLGWQGVAQSGAELEGLNASNTPFLTYHRQYRAGSEAPPATVSYTVSCVGCANGNASASGTWSADNTAVVSPTPQDEHRQWVLPINAATVPFLARMTEGSTTLNIRFCETDAAGNPGCVDSTLTFNLVAPPVFYVSENGTDGYRLVNDPQSPYAYRIQATGTSKYHNLFVPNTVFQTGAMRVLRVRILNPLPEPVVATLAPASAPNFRFRENWQGTVPTATTSNVVDGIPYDLSEKNYTETMCSEMPQNPPPCSSSQVEYVAPGSGGVRCGNLTTVVNARSGDRNFSTGTSWSVAGYLNPSTGGNEQVMAPSGYNLGGLTGVRVPAAENGQPGHVVLYVLAPRGREGGGDMNANIFNGTRYQRHYGFFWQQSSHRQEPVDGCRTVLNYTTWSSRGWQEYLTAAAFEGSGSFRVRTQGVYADGSSTYPLVGSPRDYSPAMAYDVGTPLTQ